MLFLIASLWAVIIHSLPSHRREEQERDYVRLWLNSFEEAAFRGVVWQYLVTTLIYLPIGILDDLLRLKPAVRGHLFLFLFYLLLALLNWNRVSNILYDGVGSYLRKKADEWIKRDFDTFVRDHLPEMDLPEEENDGKPL